MCEKGQILYEVHEKQWNWVMDQMIFSFEELTDAHEPAFNKETDEKINNGLKLFGIFYRALWD